MPRAQQTSASKVVEFFRTAPLETADLVMGLCRDALLGRKAKSNEARARALKAMRPAAPSPAAAPAASSKPAGKKKAAKKAGAAKKAAGKKAKKAVAADRPHRARPSRAKKARQVPLPDVGADPEVQGSDLDPYAGETGEALDLQELSQR